MIASKRVKKRFLEGRAKERWQERVKSERGKEQGAKGREAWREGCMLLCVNGH